jgi:hypothetical protein
VSEGLTLPRWWVDRGRLVFDIWGVGAVVVVIVGGEECCVKRRRIPEHIKYVMSTWALVYLDGVFTHHWECSV